MKKILPQLLGCLVLVLIATFTATKGELLNYDDERYIASNPWLNGTSNPDESILTTFFDGHYHPLTLISLKLDLGFGKDPIAAHHTVNWLLHGLNATVLLWFVFTLTGNRKLALGVALLWGLHPVAVESYAWMTERKNVLYALFFLLASTQYILYLKERKMARLGYVALFFALSCLSKAQGILLVPVLFLLDYYVSGLLWDRSRWKEKLGFVLAAIAVAYIGQLAQNEAWNVSEQTYGVVNRLFTGSYAFAVYIIHTVIPVGLSPYYPYPADYNAELSILHYLSPLVFVAYALALFKAYRRGAKLWFFGLCWFIVNVVLLLKILEVPFGAYIMADRYAYVPMMGLLIPLVSELYTLVQKYVKAKNPEYIATGAIALVFVVLLRSGISDWKSSESLWSKVVDEYPAYPHAYNMLALGYIGEGNAEDAIQTFEQLDQLSPDKSDAPINLAVLYEQMGNSLDADEQLEIALQREPENEQVLEKATIIKLRRNKLEDALRYSAKAIELYPESVELYILRSQVLARNGQVEEAIDLLEEQPQTNAVQKLIGQLQQLQRSTPSQGASRERNAAKMFMDQGVQAAKSGNYDLALENFDKAIQADPTMYEAYANRGSFYARVGETAEAEANFLQAVKINPGAFTVHAMLGLLYAETGDVQKSCYHYRVAANGGVQVDPRMLAKCEENGL
ncbi:tetratricopeptide repeat protein [Phaeocystidibacter marisrubri]|uniref:Tetratricopeptide repeat protein n=1 Tax=Phaeocystidibacter marisrubri TaxID=1577780 RepID=A0A6L3ZDC8_9FLAO|nr:tetratricopeptide repeat protein [Phaeocystidibacter marisrubri]KAB2815853.1 tetratricopeptide repeat protein [Phaeocystidibacter marisrubri]GGH66060.1 O-GlcNAc transferase [Phaeocystidibacter marisrubri]